MVLKSEGSVAIGVIGIIYEDRPNVTSDAQRAVKVEMSGLRTGKGCLSFCSSDRDSPIRLDWKKPD